VQLLVFKAERGAKDFWNEMRKTIATKEEWGKRRPGLEAEFQGYLKQHNYITCRGCHSLEAFGGARSHMKVLIHQDVIKSDDLACVRCHRNVGHIYEESATRVNGWYTMEQAKAGERIYQAQCASCHGVKLEGGAGPSLTGQSWHQMYGGAKLLTVWGEIKGPMAQDAGSAYTSQQSLDILAYLLQQNGLPSGSQPLADTRDLSYVLPTK
jgi:cytochrome c